MTVRALVAMSVHYLSDLLDPRKHFGLFAITKEPCFCIYIPVLHLLSDGLVVIVFWLLSLQFVTLVVLQAL